MTAQRFRWPVAVTRAIAAPGDTVWQAIAAPGNLERVHPFCEHNPVHSWGAADARDEVHYRSGWVYERRFRSWIDGVGYDLEIGGRNEPTSFVSWRIAPHGDTQSSLTITVHPHVLQRLPVAIRWLPHVGYVRPLLRRYLDSVTRGVDYFVTTGEPVRPNHFGHHPWFSPRSQG